mgnify:CR=1 FL=1
MRGISTMIHTSKNTAKRTSPCLVSEARNSLKPRAGYPSNAMKLLKTMNDKINAYVENDTSENLERFEKRLEAISEFVIGLMLASAGCIIVFALVATFIFQRINE